MAYCGRGGTLTGRRREHWRRGRVSMAYCGRGGTLTLQSGVQGPAVEGRFNGLLRPWGHPDAFGHEQALTRLNLFQWPTAAVGAP